MLGKIDRPADLDVCAVNRNGITQLGLGGDYGLRPSQWGEDEESEEEKYVFLHLKYHI
jgi:hypothetical protein